jgi:membrane dipeptidase
MLVDLHEDIADYIMSSSATNPIESLIEDRDGRQSDIPKLRRASASIVFGSIFPMLSNLNLREIKKAEREYGVWSASSVPISPRDVAIEQVKIYYALERHYTKYIKLIKTRKDLEELGGKIGILMHIEGCEPLYEPEDLELFFDLGVRSVGITWNFDNKFGSSCFSRKDYGLTGSGEEVVKIANKLSMMIDLSHAGERTCFDVLKISKLPPFFSHSNSQSVHMVRRNVSDSIIRAVGKKEGIVGLTMIRSCIGKPANSSKLAQHTLRIIKYVGVKVPAIGTDMLGISRTPDDIKDISQIGVFRDALLEAGLDEQAVDKIFYKNALSFIERHASKWG